MDSGILRFKTVLFDLDGTLIDSVNLIVECFQLTTETHTGKAMGREEILSLIGKPLRSQLAEMFPTKWEAMLETYRNHQYSRHDEVVKPFEGIIRILNTLKRQDAKLGIVTSKAKKGTSDALKLFGKDAKLFDVIVTFDDVSEHKPSPAPLLHALERLGEVAETSCYVGDTIYDLQSAKAANVTPIGVTWGAGTQEELEPLTSFLLNDVEKLGTVLFNNQLPFGQQPR